ncbi:ribosome maturation factor RimM [Acetanaerobacterium elongatum]|uniref:Ribosome maturation factor RimM n=1 Tax=Acetanaerobacterium elongatum TaxID=258515 RepID=A0A1G9VK76_9FIRM|nr:ribosome maturation factor RimM [Acetanaerobacterium elongatum]SDM72516.1 16S rRNA processing protein RimM [Acetanaerobacterium elongatum]
MKKQFLETGEIVTTHGIKGEVRVYPWCDTPDFLTDFKHVYLKKGEIKLTVEDARVHKNIVIMKLEGYDTIERAVTLRGQVLYISRSDVKLAEGEYFVQDLIGIKVIDDDTGEEYGVITDVSQTGANDVYTIKNGELEYLIPAIPQVIIDTDTEREIMRIKPLEGLFNPD